MQGDSKIIHLTTPAADSRKDPDTIIKPHALRAWIDDLPYANPLGMARAVLSSLRPFNRHPGKISQRPELMTIYMSPFHRIIDMARKASCKSNGHQIRSKDSHEALALAAAICSEMAYGFKHIVIDEAHSKIKITPNECASYIQLTMFCLSTGLIFDMSAHKPESRTTWREIFQLLIRSQQLGVANLEITNTTPEVDFEVSVLNTFKCILLTSLLDSSRLTPSETWGSYDYLSWHARHAHLISAEQASQHPGNYLMPRDGQLKPALYDAEKPPSNPGIYMICETHRLNILISRHLEVLSEDGSAVIRGCEKLQPDIKRHMLRQMLHIWHTNPKRRYERKDKFDRISCAFGVGSVYHFLKNGTIHKNPITPQDSSIEPKLYDNLNTYECRQENISANGMGILSTEQEIINLKIGQIVIAESKISKNPGQLKTGIVRRIFHRNPTTVVIGVQLIPGKLAAATALPEIFGRKHSADLQPCLLLKLGGNKPKALITPHLIYQADRHYVIDINGSETKRVIAGKLLESTDCLDCFEYNVLQHS